MQIKLEPGHEQASGREAVRTLLYDGNFMSDAWNLDLFIALASSAYAVPADTVHQALRLNTKGKKRVKMITEFLIKKGEEVSA